MTFTRHTKARSRLSPTPDAPECHGSGSARLSQDMPRFLEALRRGALVRTTTGIRERGNFATAFHPRLGKLAVAWGLAELDTTTPHHVYHPSGALR